jgi:Icc-related predicted phosphoesterase
MRIIALSDTHGHTVDIPEGDVLIHAGDFSKFSDEWDLIQFTKWFSVQPHKTKIVVAGNHDTMLERNPSRYIQMITDAGIIYLEDSGTEIDGVKFWGSPWTPRFYDWAFNADRGAEIKQHWDKIPDDTQVLITHGPPEGVLDKVGSIWGDKNVGCLDLRNRVGDLLDLQVHIFGHIHNSYGKELRDRKYFYNVAICDEEYKPVNKPTVIDI